MNRKSLQNIDDIKLLVDTFYGRIQNNKLLGPIFNEKIQDRWPSHMNTMYSFWNTVLFSEIGYSGSPFPKHASLPITKEHFDEWTLLFKKVVTELFEGEKADEAIWRAERMAEMFNFKIESIRSSGFPPIV
ncbi:group III truncated hemoglobin [Solitalea koreensis]|uniref:Hemoglobin n=1 Tax=Solitalea koreensis TaxID=543615 RepID=A0A521E4E4_9SPHI|nr:group III truncated hemoglobin [Solitalea koreensis]SMO78722.1 hemoglobin [Solitalea koreensis]